MKVVVGKVSEKMSEKILALLTDTPNLNIARLAEELSVSSRTVERNLKKLQEHGMLERIGGKKTGSWKVLVKQ